jgi:trans-aconitate methyltransferase
VEIHQGSAARFTLPEPVNVAISTSALHWEHDHRGAFERLFAALRPGGRLVAIFSPEGNLDQAGEAAARIAARDPYAETIGDFRALLREVFNFAPVDRIEADVRAAGFEIDTLDRAAQDFPLERPLGDAFVAPSIFPFQVQALPDDLREPFVTELADALTGDDGRAHLDGVTVLLDARRPG